MDKRDAGLHVRVRRILLALVAAGVLVGTAAGPALANGPSLEQLDGRTWTCFVPPTVPDLVVCYNSGLDRPILGNPSPPPSYSLLAFSSSSGEFLFTGHLIRADLYANANQPCAPGGEPYVFRALIGYFECVHT
jgi:hypothetical protein